MAVRTLRRPAFSARSDSLGELTNSIALYMTVISLTTVGYREVNPLDTSGQLWTMVLLITGVGTLFYAAVSSVDLVVEGTIRGYFGRRRMEAAIGKLEGHQILCGYGRVGRQVAREFARDGVPLVIIEQDPHSGLHK